MVTRKRSQASDTTITADTPAASSLIPVNMKDEVTKSFIEYSMSVVFSRALPDIQDGFKPVQRRILYAMYRDGNYPEKNYVKSAKPVASAMGNYHPHGDSSIYAALCRLTQPWSLNIPLIDPYGNFGDVTGSTAAASRYTECRLAPEAMLLLEELSEDTVPMRDNYSGDLKEPAFLPSRFPNLLINGNFGIAVGFASNGVMCNPTEAMDACILMLKKPSATLDDVMKVMPGPDLPTGGVIVGADGVRSAFDTGAGLFKVRSRHEVVPMGRGRHQIVFTELPYGANVEKILKKIKDGLKAGKFTGLADARDLTDKKNGLRFVIDTKAGVNPEAVLLELFKDTPLEESFSVNNTVLVDGSPKVVGVLELIRSFLDHRITVVTNRSQFRMDKRESRLHLVNGLRKALADIDEVVSIIRSASDSSVAREGLMKRFSLDEVQAEYILGIPLRRLTKFDQIALDKERDDLMAEIAELNAIINDPKVRDALILKEMQQTKKIIDRPRKSTLMDGSLAEHVAETKAASKTISTEVEDVPVSIFLTREGGIVAAKKSPRNVISQVDTTTRGKFIAVSNRGRAWRVETLHVSNRVSDASKVLPSRLEAGERVIALTPVALAEGAVGGIAFGTSKGVVKICAPKFPVSRDEFSLFEPDNGDKILNARWVSDVKRYEFVFMTSQSNLLRFGADKVRPQGLTGGGIAGIKLTDDSHVVSFNVVRDDEMGEAMVVNISNAGNGKVTPLSEYPAKGRATGGVRSLKFNKGEDEVAFGFVGNPRTLVGKNDSELTLPAVDKRRDGAGKPMEMPA